MSTRKVSGNLNKVGALGALLALILLSLLATPSLAQDEEGDTSGETETIDPAEAAMNELIAEGANVYAAVCQSCHQPGGVGIEGQFPPLKGNEHASDAEYVRSVVVDGKSGELTVNGATYDGLMPSFSTLSDEDLDAVAAFVAADLVVPAAVAGEIDTTVAVAGSDLPGLAMATYIMAFAAFAALALTINSPRLIAANDRLDTEWFDVALKTVTIVLMIILLVVFVPNWAMQSSSVASMSRPLQDLIGTGLWSAGLGAALFALWWAHRDSRI